MSTMFPQPISNPSSTLIDSSHEQNNENKTKHSIAHKMLSNKNYLHKLPNNFMTHFILLNEIDAREREKFPNTNKIKEEEERKKNPEMQMTRVNSFKKNVCIPIILFTLIVLHTVFILILYLNLHNAHALTRT